MNIPLLDRRRWQFAGTVLLLAGVYFFLTAKEFAASLFASHPEPTQLERAVSLSPGNATAFDLRSRLTRTMPAIGSTWLAPTR